MTTTEPYIPFRHVDLEEIISTFEALDRDRVLPIGLCRPHSYRGYYCDLAFEVAYNVTVGEVVDMLRGCVGATFEGYKGGDYTMNGYSDCYISQYGSSAGDMIGPVLLHFLTNQPEAPRD
jgi:hypothetical protein